MYATRIIAGLIAAAIGALAGAGAVYVVASVVGHGVPPLDLASSALRADGTYFRLATYVFVPTFLIVMVAVFQALERTGLVACPPTSRSPLELSEASTIGDGRSSDSRSSVGDTHL
jgi:hypothetical protein